MPSTIILMEVTPIGKSKEMQQRLVSHVPSKPPVITRFKDLAVERDLLEVAMTDLIEGREKKP